MLRYLYTLDCQQIYRRDDPLFSDVERDLDVFAIADKYDLPALRNYMNDSLVLFYETDKRPPLDPKGWSAKNQAGFANVLTKLGRLEMDTRDIRKAVMDFIARGGRKVMAWEGVQKAIEEDACLSTDLIMALLAANRTSNSRVKALEDDIEDLKERLADAFKIREDLEEDIAELSTTLMSTCIIGICMRMENPDTIFPKIKYNHHHFLTDDSDTRP